MKKALIFTNYSLPYDNAGSIRTFNLALILKDIGYDCQLYGLSKDFEKSGCIENIEYNSLENILNERKDSISAIKKNVLIIKKYFNNVKSVLNETSNVDIIVSSISSKFGKSHKYLLKYAKEKNIIFMNSIVEWYNIHNYFSGKSLIRKTYQYSGFLYNEYVMRYINKKTKNIISISSFLSEYYNKQGCNTIYIPTLIDPKEYSTALHKNNEKLTVVYAGIPDTKKDSIVNIINALALLTTEERQKIEFHIYGSSPEQLKRSGVSTDLINRFDGCLLIHDRIPYEQVKQVVANADYTVLLRPNNRNANAGFSTKVGESMACGTPVIANMTGDLDKYIINMETGIVCDDESPESCVKAYRKAMSMNKNDYAMMRTKCKEMAFNYFNINCYVNEMKEFLDRCKV